MSPKSLNLAILIFIRHQFNMIEKSFLFYFMKNELVSHQFLLFLVCASMLYSCISILTLLLASWTGLLLLVSVQSFSVKLLYFSRFNFIQTLKPEKLPEKRKLKKKKKKDTQFFIF